MLKEGWLKRQLDVVSKDIEKWLEWMKREIICNGSEKEYKRRFGKRKIKQGELFR